MLFEIRSDILELARREFARTNEAYARTTAGRYEAIIRGLCAGQGATAIANEMGLSQAQFYRDRKVACERVARALLNRIHDEPAGAQVCDPLVLERTRAAALVESGLSRTAAAKLDRAFLDAPAGYAKVAIALDLSAALLECGELERCLGVLDVTRSLIHRDAPGEESAALSRYLRLMEFRVAAYQGKHGVASRIIADLANAPGNWREDAALTVEAAIFIDRCRLARFLGEIDEARRAIDRANQLLRQRSLSPNVNDATVSVMEAWSTYFEDPLQRLVRFEEALTLSASVGSVHNVLHATIGILRAWEGLGNARQCDLYAQSAMKLARLAEGLPTVFDTAASVMPTLLKTGNWRTSESILNEVEKFSPNEVPIATWARIKLYRGRLLGRQGRFREAVAPLESAERVAAGFGDRRFHATVVTELDQTRDRAQRLLK